MRALLAYECGYGLGHLTRLAEIARRLRRHGIESVLASYRLDDADQFAEAFSRVVQGPVWPSYFASERALRTGFGPSYATALVNMGFHVSRYVAINQRAWATIIDDARPFVIVADFAPGAVMAAKGRCPSLQVGGPFSTPALDDGVFPAFLDDQPTDGSQEPKILSSIQEAMRRLGRKVPDALQHAVIGDESLPMAFAEFDPYRRCRSETLLLPDMVSPAAVKRGQGDAVYAYLPEWMQHNDVLMAALCSLKLPTRLFMPYIDAELAGSLRSRGVELAAAPFSVEELARSARVFIHHGGLGSSQIGIVAGVPQVSVEIDMEKIVNGRALSTLGVGRSLNYRRLTLPSLRDAVTALFHDAAIQQRASDVSNEFRKRLSGPPALDMAVERILAYMQ